MSRAPFHSLMPLLRYSPDFFGSHEQVNFFRRLQSEVQWQEEEIRIMGRMVKVPRLVAWYGDLGTAYTYSGKLHEPLPWIPVLQALKSEVEEAASMPFNSVLLNYYRDGKDSMGWHADDERELGENPGIASLSFGQSRRFLIREKDKQKRTRSHGIDLLGGSLLVMDPGFQALYEHSLPKNRSSGSRINLTFRFVIPSF